MRNDKIQKVLVKPYQRVGSEEYPFELVPSPIPFRHTRFIGSESVHSATWFWYVRFIIVSPSFSIPKAVEWTPSGMVIEINYRLVMNVFAR